MVPLILISAWNDSGGALVHRLFDGHPEFFCWPFELQLGTRNSIDGFSDLFRLKYRWPVFENLNSVPAVLFDAIIDDELKENLDSANRGKFSEFKVDADLYEWKDTFASLLTENTYRGIISAYIMSFFESWKNRSKSNEEKVYLGHCPIVALDADRIYQDFPDARIIHVVRSPFASICDIRVRHSRVRALEYASNWSLINGWAHVWAQKKPKQFRILHYDSLLDSREEELRAVCSWLGIEYYNLLLTPSWNGALLENIVPFGGVQAITREHETDSINRLSREDFETIARATSCVRDLLHIGASIPS